MTPRFLSLFWRQVLRQSWRHPLLTGLNIASIALGITVFLAVQIANRGALGSFRSAAELTTGRAQLEIRGPLDDGLLPAVAAMKGVRAATPLVEGVVTLPDHPGEYLRILGVDPFTGGDIFSFKLQDSAGGTLDLEKWLADPMAVALQSERWRALGSAPIKVLAGTTLRKLHPTFTFEPEGLLARADTRLAAMDIGWAQEMLGMAGRISSIQILLSDPSQASTVAENLRRILPFDARVAPPAARSEEMENMLGAFQLNLTAMSLVSIIVGMFLIYNSVAASVIRRQVDIAILRANGATRTEIRALFLIEAGLAAMAGALMGAGLAPLLASWISAPVSQSVSALYALTRVEKFELAPWQAVQALFIGLAASLGAAWLPASEAARCDPARILHPGAMANKQRPLRASRLLLAVLVLESAAALSYSTLHGGSRLLGFAAAAAVLAGFSLLVPWLAAGVANCFRNFGPLSRCASDQFSRSLHRNAITIAALSAAVAMSVSVAVMIHSFRSSVLRWISHTMVADLYITPAVNDVEGLQAFLPLESKVWATERIGAIATTFREFPVRFRNESTTLSVIEGSGRELDFVEGTAVGAPENFRAGESIAISESFARRFHLSGGSEVLLPTPTGEQKFQICGVYRDFSRDRGTILMPRSLFDRHWRDDRFHSLALKLTDPSQAGAITAAFRERFGAGGQFTIYDNSSLRQRVLEIFDQTFAVTSVLRSIAVLIAVTGVIFSLSVLVIERGREIGVLRAVGASRLQILGICLLEALLIGVTATVSGLASGGALAMVLTWVINKAFFGWTIELSYPLASLAATPLWLIPAALLAALFPAWRASRIAPAQAVRFE